MGAPNKAGLVDAVINARHALDWIERDIKGNTVSVRGRIRDVRKAIDYLDKHSIRIAVREVFRTLRQK